MKRYFIILALFALIISDSDFDNCKNDFQNILEKECSQLSSTDSNSKTKCIFEGDSCKEIYKSCDAYAPENNFVDSTCTSIEASNYDKKCEVQTTNGQKKCVEVYKTCSDGNKELSYCIYFRAAADKRCVLKDNECQEHYEDCEKLTTEDTCATNIGKGLTKICRWDKTNEKCLNDDRKCEEGLASFTDKYTSDEYWKSCINLYAETGKRCVLKDNQCKTHFENCEDLKTENTCATNIGKGLTKICKWDSTGKKCLNADRTCEDGLASFTDKYTSDENWKSCTNLYAEEGKRCVLYNGNCETHKDSCEGLTKNKCVENIPNDFKKICEWKGNACQQRDRLCNELQFFSDVNQFVDIKKCFELTANDNSKVCYIKEEKSCEEYYPKCESANKSECGKTKPLNEYKTGFKQNYQCSYNEGKTECEEVKKECSEYDVNNNDNCYNLKPLKDHQTCILNGEKCESKYVKCEDYNEDVAQDKRIEADCKAITPQDAQDAIYKYCVFDTTKKVCETKRKPCDLFKNKDECHTQYFEDNEDKRCLFLKTGKCTESLRKCEANGANRDREFCEQIEPNYNDGYHYNCTFSEVNGVKECTKKKIECEYFRERLTEDHDCYDLRNNIDDGKTICEPSGNKCIRKFADCSYYEGKDENICKSILDEYDNYKCVLNNKQECIRQQRSCTEYKGTNANVCENNYKPSSDDKRCVFVDNKCIEQFKTCALYESQTVIDQKTCESIRNYDTSKGEYYPTYLCKWSAPAQGETKGKCTATKLGCNEFNPDYYKTECGGIALADGYNKCVYNNNVCSTKAKTCKELDDFPTLPSEQAKEVCKNRETSSGNLICEANEDSDGCIEKEKPKNSSGEIKLSKIILTLLFCLLA